MKIAVKVKPNSRQQKLEELSDGSLVIWLKLPPINGQANQELIEMLAKKFQVAKSKITIKSGLSSKNKLVEIKTE